MNVCMLAYTIYEGDNRVRRYAETLVKRGDSVDAIVLRQHNSSKFAKVSGVNVYKIQKRTITEKYKIEYLVKLVLFLFNSAIHLTWLHFKKKYNVIHVHSVPDFEIFAALIPKLFGAKIILDIHDIVPELFASKFKRTHNSLEYKLLLLIEKWSMSFADHVIVANHIWHERLINRSVSVKKCSVVMNYPDPSIFKTNKNVQLKKDKFIMLYPGTLSIHQGLETAIRAVDKIRITMPDAELHIYGKGTDQAYFEKLINKLKLEDRVFIKGAVPIEKLPEIYESASIGIEPKVKNSFSNEAFSTKILEFMLMGIPVIVSDTLIHKHYFNNKLVCFFKSEDENDLAACISEMKINVKKREFLVGNALKYISENNWNVKSDLYLKILDKMSR
jgi:glycosyltransferase involved in cell wall biosynthesis